MSDHTKSPSHPWPLGPGILSLLLIALISGANAPLTAATTLKKHSPHTPIQFPIVVNCGGSGQDCGVQYTQTVSTGRDLAITVATAPSHCSDIDVDVFVDGQIVGNTGVLAAGQTSAVIQGGPVSPGNHEIGLLAHGHVGGCNTGTLSSWAGTLTVDTSEITDPDLRYFNSHGDENGPVDQGDQFLYRGNGFDADAQEISILLDNELIRVIPPTVQFEGTASISRFGDGQCTSKLRAVQRDAGGAVVRDKTINVAGSPFLVAEFVFKHVTVGDTVIQTGDKFCDPNLRFSDHPLMVASNAAAIMRIPVFSSGLFVFNRARGVLIPDGGVETPELRMAVASGTFGVVRSPAINVTAKDPCPDGVPCLANTINESTLGNTTLESINRTKGSLAINGSLSINGVLYVNGDLVVTGGISGRGTIYVVGQARVFGPVNLTPFEQNQSLVAQGPIELLGGRGGRLGNQ